MTTNVANKSPTDRVSLFPKEVYGSHSCAIWWREADGVPEDSLMGGAHPVLAADVFDRLVGGREGREWVASNRGEMIEVANRAYDTIEAAVAALEVAVGPAR